MGATSAVQRLAVFFLLSTSVSTVLTSANMEKGNQFIRGLEWEMGESAGVPEAILVEGPMGHPDLRESIIFSAFTA